MAHDVKESKMSCSKNVRFYLMIYMPSNPLTHRTAVNILQCPLGNAAFNQEVSVPCTCSLDWAAGAHTTGLVKIKAYVYCGKILMT